MQIKRNGLIYRMAYPFDENKPSWVNICVLFWRFVGVGLGRLILSGVVWIFFVLVFGIFCFTVFGIPALLLGKKWVYSDRTFPFPMVMGGDILNRFCIPAYNFPPVESLPVVGGRRVLPIMVIGVFAIVASVWYVSRTTARLMSHGVGWLWNDLVESVARMMTGQAGHVLVWYVAIPAAAILVGGWLIRAFFKSEPGQLFVLYLKAKKEKTCPIIQVV